jgi:hypothetical protein
MLIVIILFLRFINHNNRIKTAARIRHIASATFETSLNTKKGMAGGCILTNLA